MKVSVIIPALNEAECIERCVLSAWQAGASEVFVVDGGSRDDTPALARRAGARVLCSAPGRATQQNRGADEAAGDVLLFLHADNWLELSCISQIRELLAKSAHRHGAFVQRIDGAGRKYRWLERGNAARVRWRGIGYGDQGLFFRRDFFFEQGGFPAVALMEDLLLMQACRKHAQPSLLEGPLNVSARRWRKQGVVGQTLRNWLALAAFRCGASPDWLVKFYPRHSEG